MDDLSLGPPTVCSHHKCRAHVFQCQERARQAILRTRSRDIYNLNVMENNKIQYRLNASCTGFYYSIEISLVPTGLAPPLAILKSP